MAIDTSLVKLNASNFAFAVVCLMAFLAPPPPSFTDATFTITAASFDWLESIPKRISPHNCCFSGSEQQQVKIISGPSLTECCIKFTRRTLNRLFTGVRERQWKYNVVCGDWILYSRVFVSQWCFVTHTHTRTHKYRRSYNDSISACEKQSRKIYENWIEFKPILNFSVCVPRFQFFINLHGRCTCKSESEI